MRAILRRVGAGIVCSLLLAVFFLAPLYADTSDVTIGVGDTTFTVEGYTSPGGLVTITDTSVVIGSATADGSGVYTQHFTAQSAGIHNLQVYATDSHGHTTDPVALQVNVTEHANTTIDLFLPPTLQTAKNVITQGEAVLLEGEGAPNAALLLTVGGTAITTTIDASGQWKYTLATATLTPGQYRLFAIAQQSTGNQSYPTANHQITIQARPGPVAHAPSPPAVGSHVPAIPIIVQPKPGMVIPVGSTAVAGTADPGTQVEVWNNNSIVGSVFADGRGTWQLMIQVHESLNNLKARSCTGDICGDFSDVVTVLGQVHPGEQLSLALTSYGYRVFVHQGIRLHASIAHGNGPYIATIDWGDGRKDIVHASSTLVFSHRFDTPGRFNGTVAVRDGHNNTAVVSFATTVDARQASLFGFLFWLPLLILLIGIIALFIEYNRRVDINKLKL